MEHGRRNVDVAPIKTSEALLGHNVARQLYARAVVVDPVLEQLPHEPHGRQPAHQVRHADRVREAPVLPRHRRRGVRLAGKVVCKYAPRAAAGGQPIASAGCVARGEVRFVRRGAIYVGSVGAKALRAVFNRGGGKRGAGCGAKVRAGFQGGIGAKRVAGTAVGRHVREGARPGVIITAVDERGLADERKRGWEVSPSQKKRKRCKEAREKRSRIAHFRVGFLLVGSRIPTSSLLGY